MEINLENKEELQKAFDDLTDACKKQKAQLKENVDVIEEAKKQIMNLTAGSIGLADTLKAVNSLLSRKKDLFKDDVEMNELLNSLATFVVSAGSIKLGVLSNAMNKGDENNANG